MKLLWRIPLALILVGLVCLIPAYIFVFKILPLKDPDLLFNRSSIVQALSGETRVFYKDGESPVGAFFDVNHRIYVPYGEIPEPIVNALIAAEDSRFWEHNGFDLRGFSRAMAKNIRMMKLRQGGSTLTQQTVKNIFGREKNSIKEKWKELINALRMEKHFSKEDILEFYLNQFHVSGTGKGVAIAAQYFFNKDLRDLTIAECAFIAGSVKGPFNYDPFIQRNQDRREKALERGRQRLGYVLGRMVDEKYISKAQKDSALATPLHFEHGDFRFSMSTTLTRLEEKLDSDFYRQIFEKNQIEDWRKAQLQIITTLDNRYQEAAARALQTNISNLQVRLGGFILPKAELPNRAIKGRKGDYLYGAIDTVGYTEKGALDFIHISFGQLKGFVSAKTLKDFGKRVNGDPTKILAPRLGKGSILLVSVLDSVAVDGRVPCNIETEPVLQGALIAIQNGAVLASQGGFHNTGYDRSFKALRQLGSSWKPLVFAAALHYHWHYLDEIENELNLFQYNDQFYFPRPDHKNKGETVSILWAATRSENIASVWLLEHLLDKLPIDEYNAVAEKNGYTSYPDEAPKAYYERLRDKFGLTLNDQVKREIEFIKARKALTEKFLYEKKPRKARALKHLSYGRFVEKGLRQQRRSSENTALLKHNFLAYSEILRARFVKELDPDLSSSLVPLDSVKLFQDFSLADFKLLSAMIEPVDNKLSYFDIEQLSHWPDFNRSLSMAEFARFAGDIGILQKLQRVQSMSLGVNDVSLAEMTTAYQTLLTGKVFKSLDGNWNEPCLIQEIKDRDGRSLFKNEIESNVILSDTTTSQVGVMLRSVFEHGTARSQLRYLSISSEDGQNTLLYPVLGKTGTTNDYKNVAFTGGIPTFVAEKNGIALDSTIAVSSYVGFDDNRPLKSGRTRIAGASGALPQWAQFTKEVLDIRKESEKIDFLDISLLASKRVPIQFTNERGMLPVNAQTGLADAYINPKNVEVPWLDVPGYNPPIVTSKAAEEAAQQGIVISITMPSMHTLAPKDSVKMLEQPSTTAVSKEPVVEENWDLPADFSGKNAFIPIEPEYENP